MGKKLMILAIAAVVALGAGMAMNVASAANSQDSARIAALVNDMQKMSPAQIEALQPVDVKPYTLPGPSADVMRARLEETYNVAGIGEDTVELTGWIVVRHGASRPAPGYANVSWTTAVTDTEFVAMDLHGVSKKFGPVNVTLDHTRPAIGQVGRINAPEIALQALAVANKTNKQQPKTAKPPQQSASAAAACRAPVNVNVAMPNLGLSMSTQKPAVWYSKVTTIPPVGQVASVTVEPVSLLSGGRAVGTLQSGIVKFREVVRTVALSKDHQIMVASLGGTASR
ncbi:MAG TPA: DUF6073 family protein [Thermoanaerobaculia bacterium]|nr:DUF6073 family protein [Thermoanaerobaculia bacterium]